MHPQTVARCACCDTFAHRWTAWQCAATRREQRWPALTSRQQVGKVTDTTASVPAQPPQHASFPCQQQHGAELTYTSENGRLFMLQQQGALSCSPTQRLAGSGHGRDASGILSCCCRPQGMEQSPCLGSKYSELLQPGDLLGEQQPHARGGGPHCRRRCRRRCGLSVQGAARTRASWRLSAQRLGSSLGCPVGFAAPGRELQSGLTSLGRLVLRLRSVEERRAEEEEEEDTRGRQQSFGDSRALPTRSWEEACRQGHSTSVAFRFLWLPRLGLAFRASTVQFITRTTIVRQGRGWRKGCPDQQARSGWGLAAAARPSCVLAGGMPSICRLLMLSNARAR